MAINSSSNTAFIEAQQYSDFILENLHDGLLPDMFFRDVSDFGSGTTLNIKTIGQATIQEVEENSPIVYTPIESGTVTLTITDYVGDGWYVTDKMRQDGAQIDQLLAARGKEAARAIQENFETRALIVLNAAQTDANPNTINGFAHRYVPTSTNRTMTLDALIKMKLAFDKAQVPFSGRIGFIDPVVEATLNTTFQITASTTDANQLFMEVLKSGFARDHQMITNLYGWNLMTNNRLPRGTFSDGTTTTTGGTSSSGVANIFMCIADDHCKPLMVAWRQQPRVEGERNKDLQRDEFVQTARWGMGAQRVDTLGVIPTSATAVA
jgi:hypothetical protein